MTYEQHDYGPQQQHCIRLMLSTDGPFAHLLLTTVASALHLITCVSKRLFGYTST